jgi:hypothetical protein
MSESNPGNESGESDEGISDDQLPDDLNPDKNPLADPEGKGAGAEEGGGSDDSDDSAPAEGMPDMGQPG